MMPRWRNAKGESSRDAGKPGSERFAQVLDECLDRSLVHGHSVEQCLADFPEYAEQLEPQLRVALESKAALGGAMLGETMERARRRFHETLRDMNVHEAGRNSSRWRALVPGFRSIASLAPRWAAAGGAALLVAGTVAAAYASTGSLPGSPVYPLKMTTEEVLVTLTFSPEAKAGRLTTQAETRADELAQLLGQGSTAHAAPTLERFTGSLLRAAELARNISDPATRMRIVDQVQGSSNEVLQVYDSIILDGAGGAADMAFARGLAEAYSSALEAVAPTVERPPDDEPGSLEVRVKGSSYVDPVQSLALEVAFIEVLRPQQASTEWSSLDLAGHRLELTEASVAQQVIAGGNVTAGAYTRLRLTLSSASVEAAGLSWSADLPTAHLELRRPFVIGAGEAIALTIKLNVGRSIQLDGLGNYTLIPDAYLLISAEPKVPEESSGAAPPGPGPDHSEPATVAQSHPTDHHPPAEPSWPTAISISSFPPQNPGAGFARQPDHAGRSHDPPALQDIIDANGGGSLLPVEVNTIKGPALPQGSPPGDERRPQHHGNKEETAFQQTASDTDDAAASLRVPMATAGHNAQASPQDSPSGHMQQPERAGAGPVARGLQKADDAVASSVGEATDSGRNAQVPPQSSPPSNERQPEHAGSDRVAQGLQAAAHAVEVRASPPVKEPGTSEDARDKGNAARQHKKKA